MNEIKSGIPCSDSEISANSSNVWTTKCGSKYRRICRNLRRALGNVMRTFWGNIHVISVLFRKLVPLVDQSLVRRYVVWNVGPPGGRVFGTIQPGRFPVPVPEDCLKMSHNVAQVRGPKIRPKIGVSCRRLHDLRSPGPNGARRQWSDQNLRDFGPPYLRSEDWHTWVLKSGKFTRIL